MKNWMKGGLDTLLKKTEEKWKHRLKVWQQQTEDVAYVCSSTCQ